MTAIDLSHYPVTHWRYIAEGGAHIVLAYIAHDTENRLTGTVLRIRKRAVVDVYPARSAHEEEEDGSVAFTNQVVIPLLPENATPKLFSVVVNKAWLVALSDHIEPSRPAARRGVDHIDICRRYLVLTRNLVGFHNDIYEQISVEIKPKWGFIPRAAFLSNDTRPIKTQHCRFCLHRIHRDLNAEACHSQARDYCPLDLYSGDTMRVEKAIRALIRSWKSNAGKGNNFKLFWEGQMQFPGTISDMGSLTSEGDIENVLSDILVPFLTGNVIIRKLRELQANLDSIDIEGLQCVVRSTHGIDLEHLDEAGIEELGGQASLYEYTQLINDLQRPDWTNKAVLGLHSDIRQHIIAQLLSATFKDCSFFIQIRKYRNEEKLELSGFLVDCDLKSIDKLQKWAEMDWRIVQSFMTFAAAGGVAHHCET